MSLAARTFSRTAYRSLNARASARIAAPVSASLRLPRCITAHQQTKAFSMSPALNSDATASPASAREFDNEVNDMASYVHNYKLNSELAVGLRERMSGRR